MKLPNQCSPIIRGISTEKITFIETVQGIKPQAVSPEENCKKWVCRGLTGRARMACIAACLGIGIIT